ncbi:helix-turn-helix domain-containing protein [Streptomyces sp. NPDC004589]|uniref:P-loop ATPase, Sll1717 family n=1 Tax=Streptomyces sp. NPDC004589 TaxID=3154553 RepID=UPI0033B802FF
MVQGVDSVRQLFFGRDDAENDLTDGLLSSAVFRPNYAYREVLSGRKSLIIGRKGSGKSAICRRLAAPDGHPGACVLITPDDAAGDEIRRFELQGVTADTAKSLIWRYVLAVHAARHLALHVRAAHGRRSSRAVGALRAFLRANGESDDARLYDRLRRGARGLQSANLSLKAFGIEAALGVNGASEGARASRQLEVLEDGVADAFASLGCAKTHPPLLYLVDQLEQVWTVDADSHALVTGLLLAAKHITGRYGRAVRTALFIRADIYDTLNFSDVDKFHSDEIRITWSHDGLRDVALARARASLGAELTAEQLWGRVFPPSVRGEPTAEYLFGRALPRPRDAIQFLNACRSVADERGGPVITEEDVLAATERFSRWKLQDLAKEYLVNHPFLRALFAMFENSGYFVTREVIETRFEVRRQALHENFPAYTDSLTPEGVIHVLYEAGFLGVWRGGDVVYAGGIQAPPGPGEDEFHVHPCFRPALNSLGTERMTVQQGALLRSDVDGACERLRRLLDRAPLPAPTHTETLGEVLSIETEALRRKTQGRPPTSAQLRNVATHFQTLADTLRQSGHVSHPVTRRLLDEARSLTRTAGGAIGSGQGSNSEG